MNAPCPYCKANEWRLTLYGTARIIRCLNCNATAPVGIWNKGKWPNAKTSKKP